MNNLLLYTFMYIIYVELNAIEDSKLAKLGGLNHTWNWFLTAWVAIICAMSIYGISLNTVTYLFLLVPITWIVFDITVNYHLGKRGTQILTYQGSGGLDIWFKDTFEKDPVKAMYIAKGLLLVLAIVLHILI